ncbi:MAG TPA: hypothetical protein VJA66_14175 [Thermoanaerobaculia bacterium]
MNETANGSGASAIRTFAAGLRDWLPETVLLLVTTCAGVWAAGRWGDPCGDAGYAWSLAYRVSHGEKLYRDIYTQYTPLSPYLLAAGVSVFGAAPRFFLYAYWIPAIVAALFLLRCARSVLSTFERLTLAGIVIATSLFLPGAGHLIFPYYPGVVHALLFSVAAFLCLRPGAATAVRVAVAGCLAGAAFACKQEIGLAVLIGLAVSLAAGPAPRFGLLARLLGSFLAVLLLVALWALASAPYESLVHDSRLWPLAAPPSTTIHFLGEASGLEKPLWPIAVAKRIFRDLAALGTVAAICLAASRERTRALWTRVAVLCLAAAAGWLALAKSPVRAVPSLSLSALLAFLLAAAVILLKDFPDRAFVAGFAVFAGLAGSRAVFSTNLAGHYGGPAHFATALSSLVALLVLAPRLLLGRCAAASYLRKGLAIGLFCFSWWQAAAAARSLEFPRNMPVDTPAGRVVAAPEGRRLLEMIAKHAVPGQSALIIPEPYAIDALFRLRNVSPLPWASPGWLDSRIETSLLRRLESSPPDLVVLIARRYKEYGAGPFGIGYGRALSDWCRIHYSVVGSSDQGQILRRK